MSSFQRSNPCRQNTYIGEVKFNEKEKKFFQDIDIKCISSPEGSDTHHTLNKRSNGFSNLNCLSA